MCRLEEEKMDLEKELTEFYNITLELMDRVEIQGNRLYLLKRREEILENIKKIGYDTVEIQRIVRKLNIIELERELYNKIETEIINVKREIQNLKRSKQGNQAYITSGYGGYIPSRFDKTY